MSAGRKIVKEALVSYGFPQAIIDSTDSYPSISMHLKDMPDVLLSHDDDRLWIWSPLPFEISKIDSSAAIAIINTLTDELKGADGSGTFLLRTDIGLELKASILEKNITSSDDLMSIILDFIKKLQKIMSSIN